MLRVLLAIGIGGPIFGGLFVWQGFKEQAVAKESSATPEKMTLSQLIARGPNGNANVQVTDFVLVPDHAIERGRKGRVSGTWIPIVPRDAGPAAGVPRALKVLVYSSGSSSPEGIYQQAAGPQLTGLVINKIKTPSSSVEDHFKASFPQTDFSTCIYIEEGRSPSGGLASLMIFGGIAAIVIGIAALGLALVVWRKNQAREAQEKKSRRKGRSDDEDDEDEYRPRKKRPSARDDDDDDDDVPPRKRRAVADDDEDDRPRKKRPVRDGDEDEPPRKKRPVARDDEDDDRPRKKRPVRDGDEDEPPRKKPRRRDDD